MDEIEKNNNKLFKALKGMKLQPCCQDHCRDWHETKGGLPASNHSPACSNYKLETYYKVSAKGTKNPFCVLETENQIKDMCEGEEEQYDITKIEMTKDQFERLDEFDGF